ncbi:MAG TPA: hypothetical protein VNS09_17435, partial [Solirubrobacter sp.]|nr:hypothetical protein [Solirubrobacter sp.]
GTNSVKLLLAERGDDAWRPLADRAELTRLGAAVERTGRLEPAAIERTVAAIANMVAEATRAGADGIAAVGTAGLRQAANASDFLSAVRARCGVDVTVIGGEDEARLAYLATTSTLTTPASDLVVFDSGGGSSQFTFGSPGHVTERFSVDVGAVRVTERFGLDADVGEEAVAAALAAIARDLARLDGRRRPRMVIGMGGTVTNLAAVRHRLTRYDPEVIHGTVLERAEIDRQIALYRSRSAAERRTLAGLQPKRADIILGGACIVRCVLTLLGADALTVSDRGLRHGVLAERFGPRGAP